MGIRRSGTLVELVDAANQRAAYSNFRKVRLLFEKIVDRTPVLSGELRSAWNVGYGEPDYSFTEIPKSAKAKGVPALSKPSFALTYDREKAWKMYIANGTPYAARVEHGWSAKAPVGMVRISVLEVFGFGVR
jgi:hypothetical protein